MHDEQAFLQTIIADPSDDAPRLVFADWLEEHGDPRGEFIRVQCELARLPEDDPHYSALKDREDALFEKHRQALSGPLAPWVIDVRFERGLPELIVLKTAEWLKHSEEILRLAPIRQLMLKECWGRMKDLAACPQLLQTTGLWLPFNDLDSVDAATLAASPNLHRLRLLNLSHNRIAALGICAIAVGGLSFELRHLWLTGNNLGDAGVSALGESLWPLESLRLGSNGITDAGVLALLDQAEIASLKLLHLSNNPITDRGALALASSPYLDGLSSLIVKKCRFSKTAEAALRDRFGDHLNPTEPASL